MTTLEKIGLLGNAGFYDKCSGTECKTTMHKSLLSSVYPAVTGNGKCINLFKTLMTNSCSHDCKYCFNRVGSKCAKAIYEPQELVTTFLNMKRLGYVQGLFLSSGIGRDPDETMTRMVRAIEILREQYHFKGYVHLKVLPGVNRYLVHRACALADRVSINVETTSDHLSELSSDKDFKGLVRRLNWIASEERRGFIPWGLTTQFIVGGDDETDEEVISSVSRLYSAFKLRRVYFSTFTPVSGTPLEGKSGVNPLRGHRLYQTDFLLRKYGFEFKDLIFRDGFLDVNHDPKVLAALNSDKFPLEVNEASRDDLIRVPGIGLRTVDRLLALRPFNSLKGLRSIGVITKRAAPFIRVNGQGQTTLTNYLNIPELD